MNYQEFREQFKRHHICGAEVLGLPLTYDSRCPKCNPDSPQWETECQETYREGRLKRILGSWTTPE